MKEQKAKALFLAGVTGNGERARQETQRVISGLAKITQPVFSSRLERFQRPVSHVGGFGFLLVKPTNRWGFVCSSRVLPVTAANT